MPQRALTVRIRQYIVDNVSAHPANITAQTVRRFQISRQAVNQHLKALVESGVLVCSGRTRSRVYQLGEISRVRGMFYVPGLEEHVPWTAQFEPALKDLPKNVLEICRHGFTEILNNVIEHTDSEMALIECTQTAESVDFQISDTGIGIFNKIKGAFGLKDELEAVTELVKGKLTTDPEHHTGEGIFFTSRMFDSFSILSGRLYFEHTLPDDDWLIEERSEPQPGTLVRMIISLKSKTELKNVFDQFAGPGGDYEFSRTHVPVKLLQYGADNLVSRSQAKRLLARLELFKEVSLDFSGIETIGQAFADEVFRVYANAHPDVRLIPVRANADVTRMIRRATSRRQPGPESRSK